MKKVISVLLTVCLLFGAVSVNSFAAFSSTNLKYDYNGDKTISLLDARAILRVSANLEEPDPDLVYDLDGDGYITYEDVKKVLYVVTGIDSGVQDDSAYLLELFTHELNRVKSERPGFQKTTTNQCLSMLVTTKNSGLSSLDVTNMEFDKYVDKVCDVVGMFPGTSSSVSELRKQAEELYKPHTTTATVNKYSAAYSKFPISGLAKSCFLTVDDIASITSYEEDGYIYRTVTMNTDVYVGDEYPTGSAGFSQRWQKISYGKVFDIPSLDEKENGVETSVLNKVTFKDGKIILKVDKLTGMPVSVDYSYTYIADVAAIPEVDANGKEGASMSSVSTVTIKDNYVINPVEVN